MAATRRGEGVVARILDANLLTVDIGAHLYGSVYCKRRAGTDWAPGQRVTLAWRYDASWELLRGFDLAPAGQEETAAAMGRRPTSLRPPGLATPAKPPGVFCIAAPAPAVASAARRPLGDQQQGRRTSAGRLASIAEAMPTAEEQDPVEATRPARAQEAPEAPEASEAPAAPEAEGRAEPAEDAEAFQAAAAEQRPAEARRQAILKPFPARRVVALRTAFLEANAAAFEAVVAHAKAQAQREAEPDWNQHWTDLSRPSLAALDAQLP